MAWGNILSGIGTVLGGAAGLSGLFQGDKDDYHPEVMRNQATHDRMRAARDMDLISKEYGIHPLALLGSGYQSMGGFAQPVGGYGGGSHIGDALSGVSDMFTGVGGLYESDMDRRERAQARLDALDRDARDRQERRIDRISSEKFQASEEARRQAEIRRLDSETMLNAARTRSELSQLNNMMKGAVGSGISSIIMPDGSVLVPGKGSDAMDIENKYGSIVGEFHGLGQYFRDVWQNTDYPSIAPRGPLRASPGRVMN